MKVAALESYLKDPKHSGSQSFQTLEKFLQYTSLVRDPLNVFNYMQVNCICHFFPYFWQMKSEYLSKMGDYSNAFKCLQKTKDMIEIKQSEHENQKQAFPDQKMKLYRQELIQLMRSNRPSARRTIEEFELMNESFSSMSGTQEQKNQQLCEFYEIKFPSVKFTKEKDFAVINQNKPYSWLKEIQEKQKRELTDRLTQQITSQIFKSHIGGKKTPHQQNNNISENSNQRLIKSLNTPFKKRDPMRMNKTVDSVQLAKRKKRTAQNKKINLYANDDQLINEEDDQQFEMEVNTVPVGRHLQNMNRKVKFDRNPLFQSHDNQVENIRANSVHSERRQSSVALSRLTSTHTKKGILKKHHERGSQKFSDRKSHHSDSGVKISRTTSYVQSDQKKQ